MSPVEGFSDEVAFIWAVADLLRGDVKSHEYGQFILPFVVLRRLDCVLEPTKQQVLAKAASLEGKVENVGPILERVTGAPTGRGGPKPQVVVAEGTAGARSHGPGFVPPSRWTYQGRHLAIPL